MKAPSGPRLEIPPAPRRGSAQWKRGLHYLQALMEEPDATANAMDLQFALGSHDLERQFQRLASSEAGRRLLTERPDLLARIGDREQLAALPEGSVGRALLAYFERFDFDPRSLIELWRGVEARWEREEGEPPVDELRSWYRERSLLLHDFFHVLSGYDADQLGEATLLAFTLGQLPGRVNRVLTIGASVEVMRVLGRRWLPYVYRAWRRGRRAGWLHEVAWERMLARPLDEVRRELRIEAPEKAHPRGVLRGAVEDAASLMAA